MEQALHFATSPHIRVADLNKGVCLGLSGLVRTTLLSHCLFAAILICAIAIHMISGTNSFNTTHVCQNQLVQPNPITAQKGLGSHQGTGIFCCSMVVDNSRDLSNTSVPVTNLPLKMLVTKPWHLISISVQFLSNHDKHVDSQG